MVSKLKSGNLTEGAREKSVRLSYTNSVVFLEESLGIYKKMGSDLVRGSPFIRCVTYVVLRNTNYGLLLVSPGNT